MLNQYDATHGATNIFVSHLTVNQMPQACESEIITQPGQNLLPYPPVQYITAPAIQMPYPPPDPFVQMRRQNEDYRTARQFQKNYIEVQEQQNLNIDYQAMLGIEPRPLHTVFPESDPNMCQLCNSSLWEAADWCISSTGLMMPQALCGILTCISAGTWGRVKIVCNISGKWIEPLILWTLVLADSGLGKSIMFGRLLAPFKAFQDRRNSNAIGFMMDEVNSMLAAAVKNKKKKILKKIDLSDPRCLEKITEEMMTLQQTAGYKSLGNAREPATLTVSTTTGAGLRKLLLKNGDACFLASPEPEALSYVLERGGEELLKKGYNQETEYYSSAHKEILINKPSISLLCASQTEIFMDMMASKKYRHLQGGGFLARILPALANADVNNSRTRDSSYLGGGKTRYETRIEELLSQFYTQDALPKEHCLVCDSQATIMLDNIRQQLRSDQKLDRDYTAWLNKFAGNVGRMAGAIHLWEHGLAGLNREVDLKSVQMANELISALSAHAHYLYSEQGLAAETNGLKIQQSLNRIDDSLHRQKILYEGINTTDIQRRTGIARIQINNAFRHLANSGWCVLLDNGGGNLLARFRPEFFGINSFNRLF